VNLKLGRCRFQVTLTYEGEYEEECEVNRHVRLKKTVRGSVFSFAHTRSKQLVFSTNVSSSSEIDRFIYKQHRILP
jgi:hypothetical protein